MTELRTISLDSIDSSPHNPRRTFDEASLESLAASIRLYGVLEPILVRINPLTNRHEIVAGERRWHASRMAQKTDIPAVIVQYDDLTLREVQLIENLERAQLNPIEEGHAFQVVMELYHYSEAQLAQRLGRSPQYIRSRLELLKLEPTVQEHVIDGRIAMAAAIELTRLNNAGRQMELVEQIEQYKLTVPETASYVTRANLEQRLSANQASKKLNLERKRQALEEQGVVITPDTFDPEQHHRVWDLLFPACKTCTQKGKFLRIDGQIEDICINIACYTALLAQHRDSNRRIQNGRRIERQQAFERILNTDEMTTAHLQYLLWTMLHVMGASADGWRNELGISKPDNASTSNMEEWEILSTWSDEQLLTNIMRLSVSYLAALNLSAFPDGLKKSLIHTFGIKPHILSDILASDHELLDTSDLSLDSPVEVDGNGRCESTHRNGTTTTAVEFP